MIRATLACRQRYGLIPLTFSALNYATGCALSSLPLNDVKSYEFVFARMSCEDCTSVRLPGKVHLSVLEYNMISHSFLIECQCGDLGAKSFVIKAVNSPAPMSAGDLILVIYSNRLPLILNYISPRMDRVLTCHVTFQFY